jgi:hypothetical protein
MAAEKEQAALELARLLFDWGIERLDPPTQRSLWDRTQSWTESVKNALPRCRQEVDSLVAALGQQRLQWTETYRVIGQAAAFVSKFPLGASAGEGLEGLLEIAAQLENGAADLRRFGVVQRFAREHAAEIGRIHRYASDGRLQTMPGSLLERQRAKLRDSLSGGEAIIENAEQVVKAGREFIRSYCREYAAWHAQAHSPAHFKPYLEAKDSDWHAALAALSQAGLDEGGALADVRRLLAQALEKHCTGENLPAALGDSPVCQQCGIAMGQRPELPAIDEIERRARDGIRAAGSILKREDVRERVEASLREAPADVSERAGGLLTMREEAEPADVVSSCTPEVAQWLSRVLAKPAASRNIGALVESVKGKRLSKSELLRLFLKWLDSGGALSDEDYVDIE